MRIRRVLRWWPVLPVLGVALVVYALWPARYTYSVSPETTYVTEPVNQNGLVDYVTALNDRLAKDVTPDTNANVLIWQALGPKPEGGDMPPEYFQRLRIATPPDQGEYFVSWDKYFRASLQGQGPPDDVLDLFEIDEHEWRRLWDEHVNRAMRFPWKANEQPEIGGWLKGNEKPLRLMIEAGRRPKYYNPLVSKNPDLTAPRLIGSLLPSTQKCREVARALTCRAMRHAGDGDYEAAWQELLACQRLGRALARGGTLIEELVGIAIVSIATNAQLTLVGHGTHSPSRLRAWQADLRELPPMPSLADKLGQTERFVTLEVLQSIARNGLHILDGLDGPVSGRKPNNPLVERMLSRSVDFDPAFRAVNEMYDKCEAASRQPDRAIRKVAMADIHDEIKDRKNTVTTLGAVNRLSMSRAQRGEHIGNIVIGLMVPAIEKLMDADDRTAQNQANLGAAIALAAYRVDTGKYPIRLDEVVPKYLTAVPGDLFSGKPLVYRPTDTGYLLYSVGVNGIDEDGHWTDDDPMGDDLRVRMPVQTR